MSLRLCICSEFDGVDPIDSVPRERIERSHYIKHGPIQPVNGFATGSDGPALLYADGLYTINIYFTCRLGVVILISYYMYVNCE